MHKRISFPALSLLLTRAYLSPLGGGAIFIPVLQSLVGFRKSTDRSTARLFCLQICTPWKPATILAHPALEVRESIS